MSRFTFDLRFVFIERELSALGDFLTIIEPQVKFLSDQDNVRTRAGWKEKGYKWEDADLQLELQELDERITNVFPRLLRNPFLVSVWATYENGVSEIANNLAQTGDVANPFTRKRDDNFIDAASKYFSGTLHRPLDVDAGRLDRLRTLVLLRNVIAHSNGEQRSMQPARRKAVIALLNHQPAIGTLADYFIASAEYVASAYADVAGSLRSLILDVRGPAVRPILDAG